MFICKNSLRIVTITLFLLICCSKHVGAFDLDMTVDDEIRKNYKSEQLVKDTHTENFDSLPDLPEKLKNDNLKTNIKNTGNNASAKLTVQNPVTGSIKISKYTSFNVTNINKISDWQTKRTVVKFKTTNPVYKKKYKIPASTIFTGEVRQ